MHPTRQPAIQHAVPRWQVRLFLRHQVTLGNPTKWKE